MVPIRSHLAKRPVARVWCPSRPRRCLRNAAGVRPRLRQPSGLPAEAGVPGARVRTRSLRALGCCLWAAWFLAAPPSPAAEAAKLDALLNRWFAAQTNQAGWSADFTQTRCLKVLTEPLVATGKVWVAGARFRWELGRPAQTLVLRQPDQLVIFYPRLKRAEKYALSGVPPGPVKDALGLLDASMPRDRASMEEHFRLLTAEETDSCLQVVLEPKSASARRFISGILVAVRTNDFSMAVTEMRFADGSSLRNDFTNVALNLPLGPELFEANLAPDVTVVEPLRQ